MLNYFLKNNASIVTQLFKGGMEADVVVPGPKTKQKQGKQNQKNTINNRILVKFRSTHSEWIVFFLNRSRLDWNSTQYTAIDIPRVD